jgi:hypothetical protein
MIPDTIDFQNLNSENLNKDLNKFLHDYPKFLSVFALASAKLPVSKSLIITKNTQKAKNETMKIIKQWNTSEFVIRSDKKGGAIDSQSIQNCEFERVWPSVNDFLNKKLLPMATAKGDVFHNTYSINLKMEPGIINRVYLEIVGPGFCATDLNKRDIVNERGYLTNEFKLENSRIIDDDSYKLQVKEMKMSVIKKEIVKGRQFNNENMAEIWVDSYLNSIGALIMQHPNYISIDRSHLAIIWNFLPRIRLACTKMGYGNQISVVSMSFVLEGEKEKPYFWDIHPYFGYNKSKT